MKNILLLLLFVSLVINAQDTAFLKEIALKNTDTVGAVEYSKKLLKNLKEYEFYSASVQAKAYFISFKNVSDKNDIIDIVFADNDQDGQYGFIEVRGLKEAVLSIWKNNFNSVHKLKTFDSYDRFKQDGLNFSFYADDKFGSIKDFS